MTPDMKRLSEEPLFHVIKFSGDWRHSILLDFRKEKHKNKAKG